MSNSSEFTKLSENTSIIFDNDGFSITFNDVSEALVSCMLKMLSKEFSYSYNNVDDNTIRVLILEDYSIDVIKIHYKYISFKYCHMLEHGLLVHKYMKLLN
jgi:hypothetical protein